MTIEEAAEVILGGHRFEECLPCKPRWGSALKSVHIYEFGKSSKHSGCPLCEGWRVVYTQAWVEACKVLGKELPSLSLAMSALYRGAIARNDEVVHLRPHDDA